MSGGRQHTTQIATHSKLPAKKATVHHMAHLLCTKEAQQAWAKRRAETPRGHDLLALEQ